MNWARLAALALTLAALGAVRAQDDYEPYVAPASDDGARAMRRFRLADGLEAGLFAAEPMLANPVCLFVDDAGQVWIGESFRTNNGVADIRNHMDWLDDDLAAQTVDDRLAYMAEHLEDEFETFAEEHERIRVLRDTDGDGVADESVVFADGFNDHADGIGAGLLVYGNDVYYTCIPNLWRLADTDGDGRADERESLSTGYGVRFAFVGHDMHGLRIGPDGRLYFSIGDRGLHVETRAGTLSLPDRGSVLRCELDGSHLELVHTGLRNPQELAFDDFGNLFTGDNNADGGDKARWVQIVAGGDTGWRQPYQWLPDRGPWMDEHLWEPHEPGRAADVLPPLANVAAGPSGLTYYPGTGLGPDWNGHFFLCDFRGEARSSGVISFALEPDGASFVLGDVDWFLKGSLATDVDFGPDGAVYVSDWVSGWTVTGKGRVYRISDPDHIDTDIVRRTRRLLAAGMAGRELSELSTLLAHADRRVRTAAQFELVARDAAGRTALLAAAVEGVASESKRTTRLSRLHGIWGLSMAARLAGDSRLREPLLVLADDADTEVRAQVLGALGDDPSLPVGRAEVLAGLADEDARVRFFAALALGGDGHPDAFEPLVELLAEVGEDDRYLRHAATRALGACADDQQLAALAADPRVDVRVALAVIWRRSANPALASLLEDEDPRVVLEAARAIHDVPVGDALGALADRLPDVDPRDPALLRRAANAAFRVGGVDRARALGALSLRDDVDDEHRVEALEMLAEWDEPSSRDKVTGAWRPLDPREAGFRAELALELDAGGIEDAPDDVVVAWVELVEAASAVGASASLSEWVADTDRDGAVRTAALEALEALVPDQARQLVDVALGDADGELRAVALDILDRLAPAEALPRLPDVLQRGTEPEQRVALGILGRNPGSQASDLLAHRLVQLEVGLFPDELALDLVLAAEVHGAPELSALLIRRRDRLSIDPELSRWLDGLRGGSASRGEDVFLRTELSCRRCHATWEGADERVGPNLSGVGRRLAALQLLESVVVPNRRTSHGYAGTNLFLHDGRVLTGRVVEETGTEIRMEDSEGELVVVALADIRTRKAGLSAMPEGLAETLERAEMRDLLAYLSGL